MSLFLGLDIGTYQSKGVLTDAAGRIHAMASSDHEMLVPQPGRAEHRPEEDWWAGFTSITRELTAQAGTREIAGIACSAIGPCMLPVDAGGTALTNAVLYGVDTRASAEIEELAAGIGEERILARCGNALTSQSVGPKILWLRRNRPEIFERAAKIVTSTTWLVQRLTGECVIDHYTAANFSPLYDIDRQDWTQDLAPDIVGTDRLPRLMWSDAIAGRLTARAAAETGLAEGTPVTTGTIDAAAEALSVGVRSPGDMMMMYGSTIFIITLTAERVRDARLWTAPWLFRGRHAAMAGQATSGTLTHWFRDNFARELPRETAFETLAHEAAESPPGAKGLIMLPYFSGERTPIHDPKARGMVFGLDLTHGRGDLYRALLEGIAYGTRHTVETFAGAGQPPTRILAVGGGTKNPVWLQATSDVTGLPQILSETATGASFGDAFLAALATGHARPEDIAAWNPEAGRVDPVPAPVLERQYARFRALYEATRSLLAEKPA